MLHADIVRYIRIAQGYLMRRRCFGKRRMLMMRRRGGQEARFRKKADEIKPHYIFTSWTSFSHHLSYTN